MLHNKRTIVGFAGAASILALSACSNSSEVVSSNNTNGSEAPTQNESPLVVRTGTTSGDDGSNGLRFADGQLLLLAEGGFEFFGAAIANLADEILGQTIRLKVAQHATNGDTSTAELVDGTIVAVLSPNLDGGFPGGRGFDLLDSLVVVLDINGTLVTLEDGEFNAPEGWDIYVEDVRGGLASAVIGIYGENDDTLEEWFATTVIGFETNPDLLPGKASATYVSDNVFVAGTAKVDGAGDYNFYADGFIAIEADFLEQTIDGEFEVYEEGFFEVSGDLEGIIEGNGWAANLLYNEDGYTVTEDNSTVDGVFYGPFAEETAGTIVVDTTVELEDGTEVSVHGAGGFVAGELNDEFIPIPGPVAGPGGL